MISLLQRMDDSASSSPQPSGEPEVRPRPSITVLADAHEEEKQALEDWARGLDWVSWMFASVRARKDRLLLDPKTARRPGIDAEWQEFADTVFRDAVGPQLLTAWEAVVANDIAALVVADHAFSRTLPKDSLRPSLDAGSILLRNTRGARYQGLLGHFRKAQEDGLTPGHFVSVWAAVGHFFQLSLANVIAEYLRLEWEMATRHLHRPAEPVGRHSIAGLTRQLMHAPDRELRLVRQG